MGVLDFIFGLILLALAFISYIGTISMKYDVEKLTKENAQLKDKLVQRQIRKTRKTKEDKK